MDLAPQNTLLQLEHRPTELGRIRLGKKVERKGKMLPEKIEEWRLTSGSEALLTAAAALYGGTVQPWEDAPDEGFWELFTTSRELRVLIPRTVRTVSQAYEYWQGGTCERRCDGTTEVISDGPCICKSLVDPDAPRCEPMTRISLMLPDLPGIGMWRLDTGGWHAATTIPATIELLKQLSTQPWIKAILRLEQQSKRVRENGKVVTHRFAVPVLDLPGITIGKIIARQGTAEVPQLDAGERPAVPTAAERAAQRAAAITSGPVQAPSADDEAAADETQPGIGGEATADVAGPEPPHHAGARADTSEPERTDPDSGNPTPAPRCEAFSDEQGGRCEREEGHQGNHRSKTQESWA